MNTTEQLPPAEVQATATETYGSLEAIRNRKRELRKQLQTSDSEIRVMWKELFHRPEPTTKSMRMSSLMSTGAGILDGLILGWKLYRKFKR